MYIGKCIYSWVSKWGDKPCATLGACATLVTLCHTGDMPHTGGLRQPSCNATINHYVYLGILASKRVILPLSTIIHFVILVSKWAILGQ